MDNHARSFLLVAAVAPLVAVLSFWSLLTFHSYRRQWRTVDLFFVAAATQEFFNAVFAFGHALLNLTQPSSSMAPSACAFFVWASLAIRTFQVTTLASLVVDRLLTIRWPYQYRLSVRRNQVRYHIAVLAIIAILVGVASVFTKTEEPLLAADVVHSAAFDGSDMSPPPCFLLPFSVDRKFVVFVLVLHGFLVLLTLACLVHVQVKLTCVTTKSTDLHHHVRVSCNGNGGAIPPHPFLALDSTQAIISPSSTASSGLSALTGFNGNNNNNNTLWSIHAPSALRASSSLKRESVRLRREFRWKAVAIVAIVCTFGNHIPFLVMSILARFVAVFPPIWLEGGITCLALTEGFVLPILFWAVDPLYRNAVSQNFVRMSGKRSRGDDDGGGGGGTFWDRENGRLSRRESLSCSTLPRQLEPPLSTYSSIHGFVCSDTLDKKVLLGGGSGASDIQWNDTAKNHHNDSSAASSLDYRRRPYRQTLLRQNDAGTGNLKKEEDAFAKWHAALKAKDSNNTTTKEPMYCDPAEMKMALECIAKLNSSSSINHQSNQPPPSEEHIYATLSSHFSKAAALTDEEDTDGDDDDVDNDGMDDDDDDDSSLTTSASDDFEFHLTRPTVTPGIHHNHQVRSFASLQTLPELDDDDFSMLPSPTTVKKAKSSMWTEASPSRASTMSLRSDDDDNLGRRHPNSLSMNDLDLLNNAAASNLVDDAEEEVVYVLSGKSESTLSLYRFTGHDDVNGTLDRPLPHHGRARFLHNLLLFRRHSSNGTIDGGTATPVAKRQYLRNPLLLHHTRLSSSSREGSSVLGGNWKYRPAALPRQDFPWRKSPTRPFQVPPPPPFAGHDHGFYQKKFISEFL